MKLSRRHVLHLTAGAAAIPAASRNARGQQSYPVRPVRIIVGFPAGGSIDVAARLMGQWLSEHRGQPFAVENRPGAGSNIATEAAARASPDGYTLLLVGAWNAINATLYDSRNFNFTRDIAPVASVARVPFVMVVNPSFPAYTVPEFIAYAKANPGKITMASAGNGTPSHVAGELFKVMTGVEMFHVPYRGNTPALTDLIGGHVEVLFGSMLASIEQIRAGKLRPLGVTSATRLEMLPAIPTISEVVPGFEASGFLGVGAPQNTPAAIIDKLNNDINAGLADLKMKARLADAGYAVLAGSPSDFGKVIAEETEKWAKVIRVADIKAK